MGFTLLETLIALALISLLMGMIWTILSLYARLDQKGSEAALEMQLVRSLHAQMRQDLQTALAVGQPDDDEDPSQTLAASPIEPSAQPDSSPPNESPSSELPKQVPLATVAGTEPGGAASSPGRRPPRFRGGPTWLEFLAIDDRPRWDRASMGQSDNGSVGIDDRSGSRPSPSGFSNVQSRQGLPGGGADSETPYRQVRYEFAPSPALLAAAPELTAASSPTSSLGGSAGLNRSSLAHFQSGESASTDFPQGARSSADGGLDSDEPLGVGLVDVPDFGLLRKAAPWPASVAAASVAEDPGAMFGPAGLGPSGTGARTQTYGASPGGSRSSALQDQKSLNVTLSASGLPAPPPQRVRDYVPEVVRLQFRYLSDGVWVDRWQSDQQGLPRAIEVRMDIDATQEYRQQVTAWKRQMTPGPRNPDEDEMAARSETQTHDRASPETKTTAETVAWIPEYRLVIHLAQASISDLESGGTGQTQMEGLAQ